LLARAQGVSNTPYNPYGGELVAGVNPQQTQGIANINNYANFAQPYMGTALQYAQNAAQPITQQQIQQYMSPYTQNVVQATQNQFNNQNAQAQEGLKANAIRQGALGGNRVGIASAELSNQQNLAQAPVIANLMNQGYTTGLNTALTEQQAMASGAANLGGLGVAGQNAGLTGANAQIGAGTLQQQTQQQQDLAKYQQFMQQQAYPFQTAQWLAGLGTGVGSQMGGTNTTVGPAPNSLNSWLGLGAAGVGAVGQAGGWAALGSMLSRGGVAGRAEGGGVASPDTMPESIDTLMEQQKQLLDGYRSTQMFPNGTPELSTPPGMERTETPAGVFHHDPGQVSPDQVQDLSSQGRENELLGLGPVEKEKVLALIQKGEVPLAIVERAPDGTEVRAAVGTHSTAAQQFAAMLRNKSPGNTLKIEDLRQALAQRAARSAPNDIGVAGRDVGGPVSTPSAMGIAGMPWSGAQGWVPGANFPQKPFSVATPKPVAQTPIFDAAKMGKDLGTMASSIKAGFNAPSQNSTAGTFDSSGVAPSDPYGSADTGMPQYARGGSPHAVGLAAGGDPDALLGLDKINNQLWPDAANTPPAVDAQGMPRDYASLNNTGVSAPNFPATPTAAPEGVAPPPTDPALLEAAGKPQASAQPPSSLAALQRAIYGQESNFGQNAVTSDRNAHGPMQIIPATFAQFAKPGEDINSPTDNKAVGDRILSTYMQKYNGDPARAAVAYFSGPGNVAPPESPTPWIEDKSDGHKSVSGYVSDVMKRMNGPGDKGVAAPDTDVSAQSRGPEGTGESQQGTLDQPKGVSGIDISANSKLWPSLMTAGFGMMASRSPFLGVAVGEGGLHGMNTYSDLSKQENTQKLSQAQLQMKAQQLSQEADRWSKTHELGVQKAADERKHRLWEESKPQTIQDPILGPRTIISTPKGMVYTDTGEPVGVPDAAAAKPADIPPSDDPNRPYKNATPSSKTLLDAQRQGLHGQAFLDAMPPHMRSTVEAVANYDAPLTVFTKMGRAGMSQDRALGWVKQVNPDYDQQWYTLKGTALKNFYASSTPNSPVVQARAMNTAVGHAGELADALYELHTLNPGLLQKARESGTPILSYLAGQAQQSLFKGTPSGAVLNKIAAVVPLYAAETAKFYSGSAGSETERQAIEAPFKPALSFPEQIGALRMQAHMFKSKTAPMEQEYRDVFDAPGLKEYGTKKHAKDWTVAKEQANKAMERIEELYQIAQPKTNAKPTTPPAAAPTAPVVPPGNAIGERKQFRQGWGVWNGKQWVPEAAQ